MSFRRCLVLLVALLLVRPTAAQNAGNVDINWLFRTWTVEDGLPANVVQAALHTSDGFLWLGTLAGLVRFDGQQFTVFDKSNVPGWQTDGVYELLEDDRGILWASSVGGLVRYDPNATNDSSAFRVYTEADGLRSGRTKALARTPDGTVWVGSYSGGLSALRGDTVVATYGLEDGLVSEAIWTLETHRDGGLFIGTDAGVARFRNGVFSTYVTRPALPDDAVRSLYEDPDGQLWVGTNQGGIALVEDGRVVGQIMADDLGTNNAVSAIRAAPDGSVWVATTGGLSFLKDGAWSRVPLEASGLTDPFIWDVHFGPSDLYWVSTDLGGLVQLRRPLVEVVSRSDGLADDNLYAVLEDREDRLWFGSRTGGVQVRSRGSGSPIHRIEAVQHASVTDLHEDGEGRLWVGMMGSGVARLAGDRLDWHVTAADGLTNDFVRALAEDPDGTIWVGTNNGISLVRGDSTWSHPANENLPSPMVVSLLPDRRGRMWIGTVGGLAFVEHDASSLQVWEGLLGNTVILSLHEAADGTLWVGTRDAGLARITGNTVSMYGRPEGLLTDEVHAVLDDGNGFLWISSMRGIYRVAIADLDAIDQGTIERFRSQYFDRSDGLPSLTGNRAYGSPATRLHDGRMAFATDAGAVLLDPTAFGQVSENVPVRLQTFLVNGRPFDPAAGHPLRTSDRLEMHFTALNFAAPQKTQYRYRLDGLDADWVTAGARTVAFYNNLPPGSYRLLLDATNAFNQWRGEPVVIPFRVATPWHRSVWAFALYGLVVIGTLVPATRYVSYRRLQAAVRRLDAERRVQQERERISRDLHDNVGAQLSNLISGIELVTLHTNAGAVDEAARCLNSLEGEARTSIRQLRETIWALHHEKVTVDDLRNQIHRFAETQTRYRNRPKVRCFVEQGGARELSSVQALHLFRIAQEAIHNSLKYADAEHLRIQLKASSREVLLRVEDDGVFKPPGDSAQGDARFGLLGMRHRAEELGGSATITTTAGTQVHVRVPLTQG